MTTNDARNFIVKMAERIGMSFHLDTPFEEYENDKHERMFGDSTAPLFNAKIGTAIETLTEAGIDPYGIVLDLWFVPEVA